MAKAGAWLGGAAGLAALAAGTTVVTGGPAGPAAGPAVLTAVTGTGPRPMIIARPALGHPDDRRADRRDHPQRRLGRVRRGAPAWRRRVPCDQRDVHCPVGAVPGDGPDVLGALGGAGRIQRQHGGADRDRGELPGRDPRLLGLVGDLPARAGHLGNEDPPRGRRDGVGYLRHGPGAPRPVPPGAAGHYPPDRVQHLERLRREQVPQQLRRGDLRGT